MNQIAMNRIAANFIDMQSIELASELKKLLLANIQKKSEYIDGPTLHHIHNRTLFNVLLAINCIFMKDFQSRTARRQYIEHAKELESRFFDIVDALKDFEPTGEGEDTSS